MFTIESKGKVYKYRTLAAAQAAAEEIFRQTGIVVSINRLITEIDDGMGGTYQPGVIIALGR